MLKKWLFTALVGPLIAAAPAHALMHGNATSGLPSCPQGTALPDGCPGSFAFTTSPGYQISNLFGTLGVAGSGYGNASGVVSFKQRSPMNVPGGDYAVGASLTHANHAMTDLINYVPSGTYPSGCTVSNTSPGFETLHCVIPSGTTTYTDWDLSGFIVQWDHSSGGSLFLNNVSFAGGPNTYGSPHIVTDSTGNGTFGGSLTGNNVTLDGGSVEYTNWRITNGTCVLRGVTIPTKNCYQANDNGSDIMEWGSSNGGVTMNYFAAPGSPSRVFGYNLFGDFVCNFCAVPEQTGATAHGEFSLGNSNFPNGQSTGALTLTVASGQDDTIGPIPSGWTTNQPFWICSTGSTSVCPGTAAPGTGLTNLSAYWVTSTNVGANTFTYSAVGPGLANYRSTPGSSGSITLRYNPNPENYLFNYSLLLGDTTQITSFVTAFHSPEEINVNSTPSYTTVKLDHNTMIADRLSNTITFSASGSYAPNSGTVTLALQPCVQNLAFTNTCAHTGTASTVSVGPSGTCSSTNLVNPITNGILGVASIGNTLINVAACLNAITDTDPLFSQYNWYPIDAAGGSTGLVAQGPATASLQEAATTWPAQFTSDFQSPASWAYQNGGITMTNLILTNNWIASQGLAVTCFALDDTSVSGQKSAINYTLSGNVNMLLASGSPDPNLNVNGGCQKTN